MKKINLKTIYKFIFFSLLLFSCTTEEINSDDSTVFNSSHQDEEVYLWLLNQGYLKDNIEVFNNYYVVENDMIFEKSSNRIDQTFLNSSNTNSLRIFDNYNITKNSIARDVNLYINPLMEDPFYSATLNAISRWNAILGNIQLKITPNKSDSDTEILIDTDETDPDWTSLVPLNGTINGLARVGRNGFIGEKIWINEDANFTWCEIVKTSKEELITRTVQHEIGHILGFFHSNGSDGELIEGTIDDDYDSIMWDTTRCSTGLDFSEDDIKGIQTVYGIPDNEQVIDLVKLYRYRNSITGRHFYTTNYNELGSGKSGYSLEGTAGSIFKNKETDTKALYRYYNSQFGKHFYTTNYNELGSGKSGYILEGIIGYVYSTKKEGTTALYRYYNPYILNHFYTNNYNELSSGNGGYILEGIIGYVF